MTDLDQAAARAMRAFELTEGRAVRVWSNVPEFIRDRWRAAALAVLDPSTAPPLDALTRARAARRLVDEEHLEADSAAEQENENR